MRCTKGIVAGVRRGFVNPRSIADLEVWYDASDSDTVTESGLVVSRWDDKSGNSADLTAAVGSPSLNTAAQNGLDTITFTANEALYRVGAPLYNAGAATVWIVLLGAAGTSSRVPVGETRQSASNPRVGWGGGGVNEELFYYQRNDAGTVTQSALTAPATVYDNTYKIIRIEWDGSYQYGYVNGVAVARNALPSSGITVDVLTIGGFHDVVAGQIVIDGICTVAEVVGYGRVLDLDEVANVENFLNAKWGTLHTNTNAVFMDDFDRANEAIETSANWSLTGGDADIVSNELVMYGTAPFPFVIYDDPDSLLDNNDHWAEVVVIDGADTTDPIGAGSVNQQVGIVARWADSSNYYWARFVGAGVNQWQIRKVVSGSATTLTTVSETAPAFPFSMRFEVNGTSLKLFVNGVQKLSTTDSALTSGTVGLFSFGGTSEKSYFENFRAGSL